MNRIEQKLLDLKKENKKAFITYLTAGLPDMKATKEILKAQEKAGVDIVEIGIPFSDPIADGPVIQQASYEAIQNGADLTGAFRMVEGFREESVLPLVVMMYYNTVYFYGIEAFVKKCAQTGVDGLIIPDLPFEEQEELKKELGKYDKTILIQLVSPVSGERIPMILEGARGFVYCVSSMGVTGQGDGFHQNIINYLKDVKEKSEIPVMMGFGIKEAKDVSSVKDIIDGCIVGSHFLRILKEADYAPEAAAAYVEKFKRELGAL